MDIEIKKFAESRDLKSLKYIFVDSLDVDPTFEKYKDEYNYCKSIPGLLEQHIELTPFTGDESSWNEAYWTKLKMDLLKNFSDRRMTHMREVANVYLDEKAQRIRAERIRSAAERHQLKAAERGPGDAHAAVSIPTASEAGAVQPVKETKKAKQDRDLQESREQLKRGNEAVEKQIEARKASGSQQYNSENYSLNKDIDSKKVMGVGAAVAVIAAAVMVMAVLIILIL